MDKRRFIYLLRNEHKNDRRRRTRRRHSLHIISQPEENNTIKFHRMILEILLDFVHGEDYNNKAKLNLKTSVRQTWRSRVVRPSAHDWKSCIPQKGIEGSNPSFSATL